MGKELVISSNRHETKVAILEDDQLVEIYFQRANEYSLAGSIHKGRVTRVLPGMQSAFVDIGLERDAFLYVSDFFEENEEYDKMPIPGEEKGRRAERADSGAPSAADERADAPVAAESEARDRKGRRSRRRRSRGRGFPDSKYASEPAGWTRPEGERMKQSGEEPAPVERLLEPLPGESLAKYSRSASATADTADATAETESTDATFAASVKEPSEPVETPVEPVAEPSELIEAEAATASVLAEPAASEPGTEVSPLEQPKEADAGSEPVTAVAVEEAASEEAEATEEGADLPEETSEKLAPEATAQTEAAEGDQTEAEPPETAVAEESETSSNEDTRERHVADELPAAISADVRAREPRYPHRVSRRLRRKLRNAAAPEVREEEPAGDKADVHPAPETDEAAEKPQPSIADLLREGQELLVQVAKEPLGQKGARITSHIALPGRYVVYMPTVEHLGVSRKVSSDDERLRLKRILQTHRAGVPGGFIVRTAGAGKPEQEIAADMMFLYNLWLSIRQKAERRSPPALIHHDLDLVQRLLRDQLTESFKAVWVDNEELYESILRFVERLQPSMVGRVKMYTRPAPIFDAFNITAELEKALRPKVWLKSGGYIVVNQTEALVAIDVNTGKFVGKSTRLEDTIVKTNTEAIKEIVRQIRLRDLGGIIVIDFIDMDERKNRQKVMQALEEEMRLDRAPYKILQFNDFGLVAITRKRVKQTLERALCSPCPCCEGAGYVKSVQTTIGEILQEAQKIAGGVEGPNVVLRVHPDVGKVLKSTKTDYLEELEEILRRPVLVTSDPVLHPEKFDLA